MDRPATGAVGVEGGEAVGRSKCEMIKFKQIFSNNKRKVLYELTGKVIFEGEEL